MKVLIAEDDAASRRRLEKRLADWGYEPVSVEDGEQAWSVLQGDDPPPLAVLDWMMPNLDGPEICRRLRAHKSASYTYIILLTGKTDQRDLLEGLEAGADDYVRKPFDAAELSVRLRIGTRIVEMQKELRRRATRDPLTAAYNRGAILETLGNEIARATRTGEALSAVLLDVDHFKRVNDEHGHLAGDEVLREVVHRLTRSVRPYDGIGRYGGEEFLLVLPRCEHGVLSTIAERLRSAIATEPFALPELLLPVTASFGAVTYRAGESVESLLARADEALYDAKRRGRNRVVTSVGSGRAAA